MERRYVINHCYQSSNTTVSCIDSGAHKHVKDVPNRKPSNHINKLSERKAVPKIFFLTFWVNA